MKMISYIILTFLISNLVAGEPQCSRFDYEQKTLEKIIRTEILVEQVMSEIKQLKQQTNNADSSVEKMKTELKDIHAANDVKFANHESAMTELKDLLEIKPDVLFLSKEPTTSSPSKGSTIVFGTTIYDISQSYANTTGTFTVPVRGMYAFTTQMCLNHGSDLFFYYEIVANGQSVAKSLITDNSHSFCNTAQAFVLLEKGQKVYVKAGSNSLSPVLYNTHSSMWCTFSGMLIH